MARSASAPSLGPDFDDFLFAPIGEDGNGMLFSVLSALARPIPDSKPTVGPGWHCGCAGVPEPQFAYATVSLRPVIGIP